MALQVGIDLGSRTVKVVAGRSKGPLFEIQRVVSIPVEMETNAEAAILDAVGALKEELGKAPGARFGVSGKELIIRYTKVPPVPLWRLRLLMDFEVREMAEQAGEPLACDYNIVTVPGADADEETVLVAVVKEHFLEARQQALTEALGGAKAGTPASLALFNAYLHAGEVHDGEYVFLVDVGDKNVEIVLEQDGELLFARNIAAGGGMLTDAVAQAFGVDPEQAERIKEEHGNVTPKGLAAYTSGKEEQVANALIGPTGQLASMIQSSLAFARAQTGIKDLQAGRILISGGGANLRGLPEYLQSSFNCPVERFQPESGIDLSAADADEAAAFEADPGQFAVALGLAVSDSKEDAFLVDLVPESVKKKRAFTQRTLWMWASGVAAVLVLVLHCMSLSATEDDTRKKARTSQVRASSARRMRNQYEELQRTINSNNEKLLQLESLTRPAYALSTAVRLVQEQVPTGVWVEDLRFVQTDVPVDPADPAKGKRKQEMVRVDGEIVSVDKQAESALDTMSRRIQGARPGTGVDVRKMSEGAGTGSRKLKFAIEIDVFAGEREKPEEKGDEEESN